jgi:type II secretory pathway component GspD/PulD (secretin)
MQILKIIIISVMLTGFILTSSYIFAEEAAETTPKTEPVEVVKTNGDIKVKLNFQDAPLQTVLEYLSETAGLTVVSDTPLIDGRMTVISRQPISLGEAVSLVNSILKEKNLTTVLTGKILKVVTLENAKKENIPVLTGNDPSAIIPGDDVVTYVIPVSHVTATALKANLQTLVAEYAGLEANEDGNALIITDTTANIKRLMEIIKALDTHMATVAEIRVFRLINADATSAANLINSMFQQQQGGTRGQQRARNPIEMMMQMRGGGPGGRGGRGGNDSEQSQSGGSINVQVVAAADERTNSVVVRGPSEALNIVADMIKALDDREVKVAHIRVFRLKYTDAANTAQIINQLFGGSESSSSRQQDRGPMAFMRGGRGGQDTQQEEDSGNMLKVTAAADSRTNTVVVTGPENILEVVADVVKSLDSRDTEVADVKVFQLRYADAMNVAQVINELFGEEGSSSSSQQDRGPMAFMRGGPGGRGSQNTQQQESSSMLKVSAAADSRTNSVVVTGPKEILEIVADVIKNMDTQVPNVADVKVYHLEYADAQDTAELINEVFGQSRTSSQTTRSGAQQNQAISFRGFGGRGGQQQTTQSTGVGVSDVEIIASADSRTNSVVVSGPADTLEIITNVIKQLDENPEQERQIFLYPLKNANAENIMEILNNLFAEMQALNAQNTGTTGQQFQGNQRAPQVTQSSQASDTSSNDLSEETYFEADPDTNTLLVLTSSKNYKKIEPILKDLDKPIGQVLIKVLFAELSHSNSVDLGTEFSMLNLNNGGSVQSTQAFGTPAPLSYQGVASTTGLAVRTLEGDIDFTIRALQETGKLNVLSRPYILASNNQLATITVGEEVPIPTGTTEVAGQSQTTIDYRDDIGIVLNVTPSINPDGLVNMTVNPRITTRSADSVAITENLNAEAFSTRSAETKIAVRDGQTIVIGGLIEDQLTETVKKVPLLGDIPILDWIFKRTTTAKTKTELLIFLTPHVAKDASGLTPISEAERARSHLNSDEDKAAAEIFMKHINAMENNFVDVNEP